MKVFMIKDVVDKALTAYNLMKLDVTCKDNHKLPQNVRLSTATEEFLKNSKVSESMKLKFRSDCIVMYSSFVAKMHERCPLKYQIVRTAACLAPQ